MKFHKLLTVFLALSVMNIQVGLAWITLFIFAFLLSPSLFHPLALITTSFIYLLSIFIILLYNPSNFDHIEFSTDLEPIFLKLPVEEQLYFKNLDSEKPGSIWVDCLSRLYRIFLVFGLVVYGALIIVKLGGIIVLTFSSFTTFLIYLLFISVGVSGENDPPEAVRQQIEEISQKMDIDSIPQMKTNSNIKTAAVSHKIDKTMILISPSMIEYDEDIRLGIISHELAHIEQVKALSLLPLLLVFFGIIVTILSHYFIVPPLMASVVNLVSIILLYLLYAYLRREIERNADRTAAETVSYLAVAKGVAETSDMKVRPKKLHWVTKIYSFFSPHPLPPKRVQKLLKDKYQSTTNK